MNLKTLLSVPLIAILISLCGFSSDQPTSSIATTQPSAVEKWDAKFFDYPKKKIAVEETTPTPEQVELWKRPAAISDNHEIVSSDKPAKPRTMGALDLVRLEFKDSSGHNVPALLAKPGGKAGPFPVVIATHALSSNKMQVCGQVAPALTKRGFAVLAIDLPKHGERAGSLQKKKDLKSIAEWNEALRMAIYDVRQCIDVAEQRSDLDTRNGVVLVGYSLGSIIDSIVGPSDPRVKAMALMVGGTPDIPEAAAAIPQLNAMQPQAAMPHFAGRPLLMVNAKDDHMISRAMSDRLFAAAEMPKEQWWYDSGHLLPNEAYDDVADWVAKTWKNVEKKK